MNYVMSDIHGDYARWQKMLEIIKFSDTDNLVVLGDVIDRGQNGIMVLKDIMHNDNMNMILGNHEYMMLNAISAIHDKSPRAAKQLLSWITNGSMPTVKGFLKENDESRMEIFNYLKSLKSRTKITLDDGRIFSAVHGWLSLPENNRKHIIRDIWDRPANRYDRPIEHEGMLIIGHSPVYYFNGGKKEIDASNPHILHAKHFIDIDCGCGHEGNCLAALSLDNMQEFYVR